VLILFVYQSIQQLGENRVRKKMHVDEGVQWQKELRCMLLADWHSIGNLANWNVSVWYTKPLKRIIRVLRQWQTILAVILRLHFFELFNELLPFIMAIRYSARGQTERFNGKKLLVLFGKRWHGYSLVAGFNWAYDLTQVATNPIKAEGHMFRIPWSVQNPGRAMDEGLTVKDKYPLILTEIGFSGRKNYMYPSLVMNLTRCYD
jgi:hypothetical protein